MHPESCHLPLCACVARPNLMPGRSRIVQKLGRMIMIISATGEISPGVFHSAPATLGGYASSSCLHRIIRLTRGEAPMIYPIRMRRRSRRGHPFLKSYTSRFAIEFPGSGNGTDMVGCNACLCLGSIQLPSATRLGANTNVSGSLEEG